MQERCSNNICVIDVPKKKVWVENIAPLISASQKRNNFLIHKCDRYQPRPSDFYLNKYSTFCKPTKSSSFKRESFLLPYRTYEKVERSKARKQRLSVPVEEKYKIFAADLRKRLNVENEPDDIATITQLDEDFFNCIKLKLACHVAPYKTLKHNFNFLLRVKQEIGYRNDYILKIELEHKRELENYETSVENYKKQIKCFDSFIAEDYQKSRDVMEKAEKMEMEVEKKQKNLLNLANQQFFVMSNLINLDYKYGVQLKYGRFLFYMSPPSWRMRHRDFAYSVDIETKGFDLAPDSEQDSFTVMFDKLQKICSDQSVKAVLYFKQPQELMDIFENIEKQQLWNMIRAAAVSLNVPKLKAHVQKVKEDIQKDSNSLVTMIKKFKSMEEFLEEKCNHYKIKFFQILHGLFYESVGTVDVLKFDTDLRFCYEKIYNDTPVNLDTISVARAIESFYFRYVLELETLQSTTVHDAVKQATLSEERKFRKATSARQNMRRFEIMAKKLLTTFDLGLQKTDYTSKQQSHLLKQEHYDTHKSVSRRQIYSLTEAETEYLCMFTNWTPNDDPANYLHNLKENSDGPEQDINK